MNIEVRVYKRYDTDILSLHDAGFSVSKMMSEALSAYANGLPCYFFVDEIVPFDLNDKKTVRLRLSIKNTDINTISLLKNIKHTYRSNFCKQVLRNSLIQQNLVCYFADNAMLPLHEINAKTLNLQAFPGLRLCSDYRQIVKQMQIMGKSITIQHDPGYKMNVPIVSTQMINTPQITPIAQAAPVYPTQQMYQPVSQTPPVLQSAYMSIPKPAPPATVSLQNEMHVHQVQKESIEENINKQVDSSENDEIMNLFDSI